MTSYLEDSIKVSEADYLEGLRSKFEKKGYTFLVQPRSSDCPSFLGSYVPDAIAKKEGHNIAIEVKRQQNPANEYKLQNLSKLFEGQSDWHFQVFVLGRETLSNAPSIPTFTILEIQTQLDEVQRMIELGFVRQGFLAAWPLLEATMRILKLEKNHKPHKPGTVVQELAIAGYLEPEAEKQLRDLIGVRNRLVHGDLEVEFSIDEVNFVIAIIKEIITEDIDNID